MTDAYFKNQIMHSECTTKIPTDSKAEGKVDDVKMPLLNGWQEANESSSANTNHNNPKEEPLPDGWQEAIEPSSGNKYYKNVALKLTQWDRPTMPKKEAPKPATLLPNDSHKAVAHSNQVIFLFFSFSYLSFYYFSFKCIPSFFFSQMCFLCVLHCMITKLLQKKSFLFRKGM